MKISDTVQISMDRRNKRKPRVTNASKIGKKKERGADEQSFLKEPSCELAQFGWLACSIIVLKISKKVVQDLCVQCF